MSCTHIVDVRLIDPLQGLDVQTDVWLIDGDVASIGTAPRSDTVATTIIEGRGRAMIPLITDLGVTTGSDHGAGWSESLNRAAMSGGVGRVVLMPAGAQPAQGFSPDGVTPRVGVADDPVQRLQLGQWRRRLRDHMPNRIAGLTYHVDDEVDVQTLRSMLTFAGAAGKPVWLPIQEDPAGAGGVMAAGAYALRLGLRGVAGDAQAHMLDRVFNVAAETGARVHVSSVSNAAGAAVVRDAKAAGLAVTADVNIHHLLLADVDVGFFDTRMRLAPPLFGVADRDALNAAVKDGTIDAVVSGHRTVSAHDKRQMFERAVPGAPALGLVLPLMLSWARAQRVSLIDAIGLLTRGPEAVLGVPGGLMPGMPADFCFIDLDTWWLARESQDLIGVEWSPCADMMLTGRVEATFVRGVSCWELS